MSDVDLFGTECPACHTRIPLDNPLTRVRRRRWWRRTPALRLTIPDAWLADVAAHTWTCGGAR